MTDLAELGMAQDNKFGELRKMVVNGTANATVLNYYFSQRFNGELLGE